MATSVGSPPAASSLGVGSPTPTATPHEGGWGWWSSIRVGSGKHGKLDTDEVNHRLGDGQAKDQSSKVSLRNFFHFGGYATGKDGECEEEEEKDDKEVRSDEGEEGGPSELDVDTLLWEAQVSFFLGCSFVTLYLTVAWHVSHRSLHSSIIVTPMRPSCSNRPPSWARAMPASTSQSGSPSAAQSSRYPFTDPF